MAINDFFVWGKGGAKLTPEQVKRQQMQAQALQQAGADFSPAGHWSVALGRGLSGFMGGLQERRARDAENAGIASANEAFNNSGIAELILGGGAAPQSYAPQEYSSTSQVSDRSIPQSALLADQNSTSALSSYLTPDKDKSHLNFEGDFASRMERFLSDAPGGGISIYSGYRSPERQAQLWEAALKKYGSPEAARKWVAPPGRSNHNHGTAADLRYASDAQKRWAHENAAKYGLHFRLGNEPWHIEPIKNWKGAGVQVASADPNFMPDVSSREIPLTALQPSPVVEALATQPQQPQVTAAPAGQPNPVSEALLAQHDKAFGGALALDAGAGTAQQAGFPQPPQQRSAPNMAAILQLANNPYLNDTQRTILGSVLQQQMQANDPLRALQLQAAQQGLTKGELEIAALRAKPTTKYGFTTLPDGTVLRTNDALGTAEPIYEGTPKPTPDVQNYEYAKKDGYTGTFDEYQRDIKKAGAQTTNINTGSNSSKFVEESDKSAASRMNDYVVEGGNAVQIMSDMEQLLELGSIIGTGKEAEIKSYLGPYAEMFGINIANLGEAQAFKSITDRLAPQMRPAGAGSSSDTDVKMYLNSLPNLRNSPEGNTIIANTMRGLAQNKIEAAEIAAKAQSGEITWQEAEKQIRALPNPYENFKRFQRDKKLNGNKTKSGVTWSVN